MTNHYASWKKLRTNRKGYRTQANLCVIIVSILIRRFPAKKTTKQPERESSFIKQYLLTWCTRRLITFSTIVFFSSNSASESISPSISSRYHWISWLWCNPLSSPGKEKSDNHWLKWTTYLIHKCRKWFHLQNLTLKQQIIAWNFRWMNSFLPHPYAGRKVAHHLWRCCWASLGRLYGLRVLKS